MKNRPIMGYIGHISCILSNFFYNSRSRTYIEITGYITEGDIIGKNPLIYIVIDLSVLQY